MTRGGIELGGDLLGELGIVEAVVVGHLLAGHPRPAVRRDLVLVQHGGIVGNRDRAGRAPPQAAGLAHGAALEVLDAPGLHVAVGQPGQGVVHRVELRRRERVVDREAEADLEQLAQHLGRLDQLGELVEPVLLAIGEPRGARELAQPGAGAGLVVVERDRDGHPCAGILGEVLEE